LRGLGLGQYEQAFRDNDVDADLLPTLTAENLRELGVASLGHRKRFLAAIAALVPPVSPAPSAAPPTPLTLPTSTEPQAERRQLTVMFADLVGSTALSARLDPEDMGEVIRAYQNAVAGEVARFEGHVAKFMGDGVLAYFGWPTAHEDDAERAVRAGLAVADAIAELPAPGSGMLACRVGIGTGPVVVGELIGTGSAAEEVVVGETPNLAARLQGLTEPGAVVIAEGTRRLLGDLFALAELGPRTLKGFIEPVRAWRVLGEGAAESRFEAMHAAGLMPLVGREHELALLLDRWEQAKEGEGQAVLLSGEAGIGKSRLVRALRERFGGEPHTWLGQFCSPYHADTALHPVIGQLDRAAGLRREDPPERQLDKLEAMLRLTVDGVREAAPLLADLLSIPVPPGRYPPLELSPQQRKERTFRVLLDQLAGLAARRPVLTLYEDVHWADPTTLELIGRAVERVQHLPILVLVTFRPEFVPPWSGHGHLTGLSLGRLGRRQGSAMVQRVAGGKALPPQVLEQILARTEGVPLFVEELTKAVLESDLLKDKGDRYELSDPLPPLAIPSTLRDSLTARLDRLAPVKGVAQLAAVIGREFSGDLLAATAGLPPDKLRNALDRLVAAELIFRRGETGYVFKHALVRDAAYESLLKSRRQELHARIAAVLETESPEEAAAGPELLARHFAGAGLAERAVAYWQRAAERAIARSANLEAIAHCESAEAQLRSLPPSTERSRAELEIQFAKGVAVRTGKGYSVPEAERAALRACELCDELGDRGRLVLALRALFTVYYIGSRWRDVARVADRIEVAAEQLEDRVALSIRWYTTGLTKLFLGDPAEATRRLREGLRYYDEGDRDLHIRASGHDMATLMLAYSALGLLLLGRFGEARQTVRAALTRARELDHPPTLASALWATLAFGDIGRTDPETAVRSAELCAVAAEYRLPFWAARGRVHRGRELLRRGAPEEAVTEIEAGLAAEQALGARVGLARNLLFLAEARTAAGDLEGALASLDDALDHANRSGERWYDAELHRSRGSVLRHMGQDDAAADSLSRALEVACAQGACLWELRGAHDLARLWRDQGRCSEADDLLAPIYASFTEGFDMPDLRAAKELLDELR
jgi:class 3 adenylate cyclase/predicted ATPase